jgi:hypothetical protein
MKLKSNYVKKNVTTICVGGIDLLFFQILRRLRQSNNLKTIAKLEKYKMYGIDTSRDKSRDFHVVSLTS